MSATPVSVVIVSRGRPDALLRCLTGVSQLFHPVFEVIVVADPPSVEIVRNSSFGSLIKLIECTEANISVARNLGIGQAAGEIVAFIDDDAVPEPTWLNYICAAFDHDEEVMAAGGFVRGRNGISFQWKARSVDVSGATQALAVDNERPTVLHPQAGRAIKTEGTNMAVRRDVLAGMGGFDTAFAYYLDETDLNLRLANEGHATAIVPNAEVHHGFHANDTRTKHRAPRDLFEIGASMAVFLRKHCPEDLRIASWLGFIQEQHKRALRFLQRGDIEPRDVRRLMASLKKGYEAGNLRVLHRLAPMAKSTTPFLAFARGERLGPRTLSGRWLRKKKLRSAAKKAVKAGHSVSLFIFSPTTLFHQVQFRSDGYWEQRGGLFGRSDRSQPLFRIASFRRRLVAEKNRVAAQRYLHEE